MSKRSCDLAERTQRAFRQRIQRAKACYSRFTCQTALLDNATPPDDLDFRAPGVALSPFSFSLARKGNGAPGGAGCVAIHTLAGLARVRRAPCEGARTPMT